VGHNFCFIDDGFSKEALSAGFLSFFIVGNTLHDGAFTLNRDFWASLPTIRHP